MNESSPSFSLMSTRLFVLSVLFTLWFTVPVGADDEPKTSAVAVGIFEGIPDKRSWDFTLAEPTERYSESAFGFTAVPKKWSKKAILLDRSNPFLLQADAAIALPAGEYRLLLRSRNAARLFLDDEIVSQTDFIKANASGHESVPDLPAATDEGLRLLPVGHQEKVIALKLDGGEHQFRLQAFVGGQKLRMELGEICVAIATPSQPFRLLSRGPATALTDEGWLTFVAERTARLTELNAANRKSIGADEAAYWDNRHELARREWADRPAAAIPDLSPHVPDQNSVDRFISRRLAEKNGEPAPLTNDLAFLRRASLDTVGVIPTPREIEQYLKDEPKRRRMIAIDRLLADSRWADHWVSYWQDVLAENPGILKPTLNNTGPFRWWIYQAFLENMPLDRFVTELLMMEGSQMYGGPAGFAMATLNDAPMAAKAQIASKAFLGIELQCARCHDAPFHPYKQKELFSLAALLSKAPVKVPTTSTVPKEERQRRPLVEVTLEPGSKVDPVWPFHDLASDELPEGVLREENNPRERFAAILTSPRNERFAQVIVNRIWKRYLGWGLVEPVDDWSDAQPSHPELLSVLARELITHDYDLKHVARLILNSHTYQREARTNQEKAGAAEERLFAAPARRRMTAEQLVDSLFLAVGKEFRSEELNLDVDGRRPITEFINLGTPRRAWEFTSLSNERDRPALSLPAAQSIVDLLTTFGWRESRQNPLTVRDETPTPLQPLVLANGVVGSRVTRLSDDSVVTNLCLEDRPLRELVRAVFLQLLSRPPSEDELQPIVEILSDGYSARRTELAKTGKKKPPARVAAVSWSNHLNPEATRLKLEQERAARAGDPPTDRLVSDWRERMEDVLWALVNSPEFVFVP